MSLLLALQGGGGTTTLTPTEANITVAGVVAALVLSLAPSTGSISVAGNAPTITNTLAPTEASVVVAGQTPSLLNVFGPSSGSAVVAGGIPSVAQALFLEPASGAVVISGEVPALSFSVVQAPSAAAFSGGYYDYGGDKRRRTPDDLRRERDRFGISIAAQAVISAVAAGQAERLEQDAHKRFEELERELRAKEIAWKAEYLTALNAERERLITAEIAALLQAKQSYNMAIMLALIAAVV